LLPVEEVDEGVVLSLSSVRTARRPLPGRSGPPPPAAPVSGGAWRAAAHLGGRVPGWFQRWHGL